MGDSAESEMTTPLPSSGLGDAAQAATTTGIVPETSPSAESNAVGEAADGGSGVTILDDGGNDVILIEDDSGGTAVIEDNDGTESTVVTATPAASKAARKNINEKLLVFLSLLSCIASSAVA